MKILLSIILIAISPSLYAQVTVNGKEFKKGELAQNEHIYKFQGKYVWKKGNDMFTLVMKKDTMKMDPDNPIEILRGTYEYTQNEKTVYSYAKNPVVGGNFVGVELLNDELIIYFLDGTTGARGKGLLGFNTEGDLIWKLKKVNEAYVGKPKDLSVPTEMILEKISN